MIVNVFIILLLAAVIIGREITMSALRELAASLGGEAYRSVAVSSWGKWKTATQVRRASSSSSISSQSMRFKLKRAVISFVELVTALDVKLGGLFCRCLPSP